MGSISSLFSFASDFFTIREQEKDQSYQNGQLDE